MLSTTRRFIACLACVALVLSLFGLSGCYLYPAEEEPLAPPLIEPKDITYSTQAVKRGSVEQTVQMSGTFRAERYYECMYKSRGGYVQAKNVRTGQVVQKGDVLIELDTGVLVSEIRRKEIAVERAQMGLNNARKTRDKDAIQLAQWDLELADLDLSEARTALEEATLTAPADGKISYMAKVNVGDYVNAYTTLVRIDNADELILEIDGEKVANLDLGMKVDVTYNRQEYVGEVVMTPRTAPDTLPEEQRKNARIVVEGLTDAKLGDNARVVIVQERRDDVIVLPKNLLRNFLGRKYVQVLVDGLPVERDVEVGLETNSQVEIIAGLDEGELVIDR